jgi:hypothetical protein
VKNNRSLSFWRLSAWVGVCLGAVLLAVAVIVFMFGKGTLNEYGKGKIERAFAKACPGYALRIGGLEFALGADRLVVHSVTLTATNATLKIGRLSLAGVPWTRLLWGRAALVDVLAQASLEARNVEAEFPQSHYEIRCARLRASVPASELIVDGTELRTLVGDEEFFKAHEFRTARFHAFAPECRVLGLAYGELLQGKSYRARSVHLSRPSFDALVNRDRPTDPFVKSPLMVHEALAAIRQPLRLDNVTITDGHLVYREQVVGGADPGVLTIAAVNASVEGIANGGETSAAIRLQAQGDLMGAGALKLLMSIPIVPGDFSLHYSGSLSAMDLTRLNAFLEIAEHLRIKSGSAQEAAFEIDVTAGQARGRVRAGYKDLEIAVLDKQTGTEKGFENRIASWLTNELKIRNSNVLGASNSMKTGEVNYARRPDDEFQQFLWFALRSGILDIISH